MNPQDKQPYQYTKGDLERYLAGTMSPAEMHRLEKAALDDPFLSEALEGMLDFSGADISKDLQALEENINLAVSAADTGNKAAARPGMGATDEDSRAAEDIRRMGSNAADQASYPMYRRPWFRVAAAVLFLLGFASVTLYLLNSDNPQTIASLDQNKSTERMDSTQQAGAANPGVEPDASLKSLNPVSAADPASPEQGAVSSPDRTTASAPESKIAASEARVPDSIARSSEALAAEKAPTNPPRDITAAPRALAPVPVQDTRQRQASNEPTDKARASNLHGGITEKMTGPYVFTGQVLDPEGKPISFVNLRIRNSAATSYSDARGYYRLVSGDSSLQVELKAYGFQGRSMSLSAARPRQDVRLQPGTGGVAARIVRPKASAKEEMTKMDEDSTHDAETPEAEPSDGWGAYQYYLLNNLRMPQDAQQQKLRGTVDISFLVSDNGRLSDFRIEKSLSPNCDREAIRLVREGPAWTLYNSEKPLRARVTVVF